MIEKTPTHLTPLNILDIQASVHRCMLQVGVNGGLNRQQVFKSIVSELVDKGYKKHIVIPTVELAIREWMQPVTTYSDIPTFTEEVINYVQNTYKIRFNVITHRYEVNGEILNDRLENSIWLDTKSAFERAGAKKEIAARTISSIIQSDKTLSLNPLKQFYIDNIDYDRKNALNDLFECFDFCNAPGIESGKVARKYITKWLVGVVSSVFDVYNIYMLILVGDQGTHKSTFFQEFLPGELTNYFSESIPQNEKDYQIQLAEKLIILDDECEMLRGKAAHAYKRVTSTRVVNQRAAFAHHSEQRKRIGNFCGTANDMNILPNDPQNRDRRSLPIKINMLHLKQFRAIDKISLQMCIYDIWVTDPSGFFLTDSDIAELQIVQKAFKQTGVVEELCLKVFEHNEAGYWQVSDVMETLLRYYPQMTREINSVKIGLAMPKLFALQDNRMPKRYKIKVKDEFLNKDKPF